MLISIGGVGTIVAVTGIFVFLVWVVVPLFQSASHELRSQASVATGSMSQSDRGAAPLWTGIDEYRRLGVALEPDGKIVTWRASDGKPIESRALFTTPALTSISTHEASGEMAFGFADGSVRLGSIDFATSFVDPSAAGLSASELAVDGGSIQGTTLLELTNEGQLRAQTLDVRLLPPLDVGLSGRVVALDRSEKNGSTTIAAIDEHGKLVVSAIARSENLLTGEVTATTDDQVIPLRPRENMLPERLLLSGNADTLYLVWHDGILQRYDVRDPAQSGLAEELDLVEGPGELTALTFLIGKSTLVSGDSRGRVRAWFGTKPANADTRDGIRLQLAHELCAAGAPITTLSASERTRVVCAGTQDGKLLTYHVTSHKLLFETVVGNEPIRAVALAPKDNGLVALTADPVAPLGWRFFSWDIDLGYPEATLAALFTPVWYEGYEAPVNAWQSTGSDSFEPKLGLWPLVFGTIKATFYSMIFGVPIALLAAIFTSEFMDKRLRTPLKSLTEMMASLPSVVLGFIAAIIIAPIVQSVLPTVLAVFFTIPMALLIGAYLWQLLPPRKYVRWSGAPRFAAICTCLPIGVLLAALVGPWFERAFFAGDIMGWLNGRVGTSVGGWLLLLLPVSALICAVFLSRVVDPWVRRISATWDRGRAGRFDLGKIAVGIVAAFVLALVLAHGLDATGADPRGGVLDTYVQRNALIVGFVMAFAIIPIVYTLAEDALSSVPGHLRLASLGAGATPWQTAARVVVPTAMSGLFSAVMIGLGRAVGETMIVLMATGNTPVMSWNVFNGFRTLSANIAVELPEAVRNSTHYRTLFLAAFCLFALTFVLNTLAEVVRQRFRKRAYQL